MARINLTEIVGHRPQDTTHARIAVGSSAEPVDLMTLPPQAGWAAIITNGETHMPVRVRFATEAQLGEHTARYTAPQLVGADLEAATEATAEPEPVETAEEALSSADQLLAVIRAHGPLTLNDIAPKDKSLPHAVCDSCPGWTKSRRTASTARLRLEADGRIEKEGSSWVAV